MRGKSSSSGEGTPAHIIYDKTNGRILGRYRRYDLKEERYTHGDSEEVLDLFKNDEKVLSRVEEGDTANLGVLTTGLPADAKLNNLRVSEKRGLLVDRPRLRMRADRDAIEGDGQDSLAISIDVIDSRDTILRDYDGEIHVTTSRGKLSARGGRVTLERGQATVTLTSVRETVDEVIVQARSLDRSLSFAQLIVRFE